MQQVQSVSVCDRAVMHLVVLEISIISERQAKSVILIINFARERRNEIEAGRGREKTGGN